MHNSPCSKGKRKGRGERRGRRPQVASNTNNNTAVAVTFESQKCLFAAVAVSYKSHAAHALIQFVGAIGHVRRLPVIKHKGDLESFEGALAAIS